MAKKGGGAPRGGGKAGGSEAPIKKPFPGAALPFKKGGGRHGGFKGGGKGGKK